MIPMGRGTRREKRKMEGKNGKTTFINGEEKRKGNEKEKKN